MKRALVYLFGLLGTLSSAQSEFENIRLGISSAFGRGLCEPSIAISPADPAHMVAGSILDQVFTSQDSGRSWQRDTLTSPYGVWGDPVLHADQAGNFYYFHLSDPTGRNWQSEEILDRIVVQRSVNNGKTWSEGSYFGYNPPKDQDKHWVAEDPQKGIIYATWTQFDKYGAKDSSFRSNILFSASADSGLSWRAPMIISENSGNCLDGDSTTEGAVPAVGPNGELYVTWSYAGHLYFDRSLDQGQTWLPKDRVIAQQPGGWDIDIPGLLRCNGMPVTVANRSTGDHRGEVYVLWVDDRRGNYDVWFTRSKDRGDSWSEPLRINDDDSEADQFLAWLDVDQSTGYLYAVFYDRRNYNDNRTDVFLAISQNGGETWKNIRISASPFTPVESVFFGDYNHIDVQNGVVRPIWTRFENGQLSIWTALINQLP